MKMKTKDACFLDLFKGKMCEQKFKTPNGLKKILEISITLLFQILNSEEVEPGKASEEVEKIAKLL